MAGPSARMIDYCRLAPSTDSPTRLLPFLPWEMMLSGVVHLSCADLQGAKMCLLSVQVVVRCLLGNRVFKLQGQPPGYKWARFSIPDCLRLMWHINAPHSPTRSRPEGHNYGIDVPSEPGFIDLAMNQSRIPAPERNQRLAHRKMFPLIIRRGLKAVNKFLPRAHGHG